MGDIQDITKKERELEELRELKDIAYRAMKGNWSTSKEACEIINLGYTKHAFDVEELKERLEAFENFENSRKKQGYPKYDSTEIFVQIKKIIKELEDGT